ncbi:hypothetical protein NP095_09625 [Aeromicrobium duanguangcaii]|uniref:Uncharacterized protein n=1 Tax=Aeromicrobium duanguangcaii TaxID=2968086 RepID=A0ABY5KDF7_9ACTN|nr:hypothetical protein [Aeromicrobium duanguangcaii]UUI67466.1 hypothetical protein NP095_09625 [Aeromicrobium duanguangcaii]
MTSVFDGFFDDAAIFPPGNAPVEVAVKQHETRRAGPQGGLLGPLVCDTARLPAVLGAATEPLRLSLVGGVDETASALASTSGTRVEPVAVEVRGPVAALPDLPVRTIAVEMAWGSGFDVPAGAVLKLRCGGEYVPTPAELGAAIAHCVRHDQPFKLTAGLHSAVAHDGAHGFVNVMAAVVAAMHGDDPEPVLTAAPADLDLTSLAEARRLFRSIGTCDLDEPLAGLRELGLVA